MSKTRTSLNPEHTHIAVLMGGLSAESDVSRTSGKQVANALKSLGFKTSTIEVDKHIAQTLTKVKPDIIFNALHGNYGEDGCIQGLLEILGIPYTHSGVLASALAMDKEKTKHFLWHHGIQFPKGITVFREDIIAAAAKNQDIIARPYVIKPTQEGSSVGVNLIMEDTALEFSESNLPSFHQQYLLEEYIPGKELSVAVLGEGSHANALGVIEIAPKAGFYDYTNKYTDHKTDHILPAPISEQSYHKAMDMALKAHRLLGCRGLSRSDFRFNDAVGDEGLYMLEINTQPGLTPLSLAPEIANYAGISFQQLILRLVEGARCGH